MLSLKPGVRVGGLQPEILLGVVALNDIYTQGGYHMVLTAVTDGKHMEGSLHYEGQAVDVRTRDISPTVLNLMAKNAREALGPDYDIVLEGDHLHMEYQEHTPK